MKGRNVEKEMKEENRKMGIKGRKEVAKER